MNNPSVVWSCNITSGVLRMGRILQSLENAPEIIDIHEPSQKFAEIERLMYSGKIEKYGVQ